MMDKGYIAIEKSIKLILVLAVIVLVVLGLFSIGIHNKLDLFLPSFNFSKDKGEFKLGEGSSISKCPEEYPVQVGEIVNGELKLCDEASYSEAYCKYVDDVSLNLEKNNLYIKRGLLYQKILFGSINSEVISITQGDYFGYSKKVLIYFYSLFSIDSFKYLTNINDSKIFNSFLCRDKIYSVNPGFYPEYNLGEAMGWVGFDSNKDRFILYFNKNVFDKSSNFNFIEYYYGTTFGFYLYVSESDLILVYPPYGRTGQIGQRAEKKVGFLDNENRLKIEPSSLLEIDRIIFYGGRDSQLKPSDVKSFLIEVNNYKIIDGNIYAKKKLD
jgi:hypothetical protein